MIDDETLDRIRRSLPKTRFRTSNLAAELHMNPKKLAFILAILKRQGEVTRFDVRVQLGGGFKTSRSFWRKTA